MTDDLRPPIELPTAKGLAGSFHAPANVPVGAFTGSVLFDALSVVAETPEKGRG